MTAPVALIPLYGEASPASTPKYWKADPAVSDDGVPFLPSWEWQELVPAGIDGEAVLHSLTLAIGHTLGGTFRVTAVVDGSSNSSLVPLTTTYTIEPVPMLFTLPQQAVGAPLRLTTIIVPLVQRMVRNGAEWARWYRRGNRIRCKVEAVTPLGAGQLRIEAAGVDATPIRRSDFTDTPVASG